MQFNQFQFGLHFFIFECDFLFLEKIPIKKPFQSFAT